MFPPASLKFFKSIFLLLGCLHLAFGSLNLLQFAAWAGMLVDYSRGNTVAEAVEMTFDGKHPCPLCCAIAEVKKEEPPATPSQPKNQEQLRIDLLPLAKLKTISGRSLSPQRSPRAGQLFLAGRELASGPPSPPPQG